MLIDSTNRPVLGLLAATVGACVLTTLYPNMAYAANAGGGAGLPWENGLVTIARSIQGPVAYAICLFSMVGLGAMLTWGADFGDILRRILNIILACGLIIGASGVLSTLFNVGAGV